MNLRFQIAAFLVMLIVVTDYLRCPKLRLTSQRLFSLMLGFSLTNLVFDVATVYTVTHLATTPAWLNRLLHQFFIGTLDTAIYLLFLYVVVLGRSVRHLKPLTLTLLSLPYAASLGMVAFGDLHYLSDAAGAYSYGPMATTVYLSVAFYILMIYAYLIRFRSLYLRRTRCAIWIGTAIWVAAAVVQFFFPRLLLSGLALTLMTVYVYLAFENPKELYDRQTSCFTRRAFHLTLTETFSRGQPFCVVNLVLDDLAQINDSVGYATVSSLLGKVGEEMHRQLGRSLFQYRWNSLAVIVPQSEETEPQLRARLNVALERFNHRWRLNGLKLYLRCHADVIECPRFAKDPDELYDLLEFLYARNVPDAPPHVRFADEESRALHARHSAVEKLLREALANDGLEVVYQPIYSAPDGAFTSAEALVRLKDTQTLGFVPPDEFIPIAEQTGIVAELGETVLDKGGDFAMLADLRALGVRYVEVNLSGVQIVDAELPAQMTAILERHGVEPGFINFEITESAAIQSSHQLRANMLRLRQMGSSFSMDDFGTGYSNLSQIARTRYDLVKLDKSLIWPCFGDVPEQPTVILRNIVSMIRELGTPLVAEGVETREQADALVAMGVEHLQGSLYSKPITEDALIAFLREKAG